MSSPAGASAAPAAAYTLQHLRYRPALRALNAAAGLLLRLVPRLGRLERADMLAAARADVGALDLGGDTFVEAMDRILAALRAAPLTALARVVARQTLQKAISNRLRLAAWRAAHPEVDAVPLRAPVFILGFPRTGTTLLQNLLALDPGQRALRFWELQTPAPGHPDPAVDFRQRLRVGEASLAAAYFVAPEMAQIHAVAATSFEECWPLFFNTFHVLNYDLQSGLADYGDWLLDQDLRPAYAEYRRALQTLCHAPRGPGGLGPPTERLILKCPEHLWFLDALLDVFPDARIVWTHRDPVDSVASYCSLISLNHRMLYGQVDPVQVGAHIARRFESGVQRAMAVVDRRVGPDQVFHVDFRALRGDPLPTLRALKGWLGQPHDAASEARAAAWLAAERSDKPGQHLYGAEMFGLDPDALRGRFASYIDRFQIPVGGAGSSAARLALGG